MSLSRFQNAVALLLATALTACDGGGDLPEQQVLHTAKGVAYSYDADASPVSAEYLEAAFDYYLDYWTQTRIYWNASEKDVTGVGNHVIFDCTFRCSGSPNGLCAGQGGSRIDVAYYRLRKSVDKPASWEQQLNPRTRADMVKLSGGNSAWSNSDNQYYWCEAANPPMPALLHEWDHIVFDPHDPLQNALIVPLPLDFIGPADDGSTGTGKPTDPMTDPVVPYHVSASET